MNRQTNHACHKEKFDGGQPSIIDIPLKLLLVENGALAPVGKGL
jgi:hypothetical protein